MKMNKRAVLFVSLFAFTSIVAVAMPFYTVNAALVPCGLSQDDPNTPGIDETHACTTCDFFVLADRAKNFLLIDILTPVAVLFIVIGGIMILTAGARPANIQYGKKIISDTIIGVFIIFSAWMITNTIIQLFAGSSNLSTWYSISCKEGDIKIGGTTPPGQVPPSGDAQSLAQQILAKHPGTINLCTSQSTGSATTCLKNIQDTAAGRCAQTGIRTCVSLSTSMLRAMLTLSNSYRYSVSAIAGGGHCKVRGPGCAGPSAHYFGRAFDINWINGKHVGPNDGNSYRFMQICLSSGARQVIGPHPLPPGAINNTAHNNHIHCGW